MRNRTILFTLAALNIVALVLNICSGSIHIPLDELLDERWQYIIWQSRMPSAVTALLTGAALGSCGLLLQGYFRNVLAGPSILGITSGANLMVALVTLGSMQLTGIGQQLVAEQGITVIAAFVGAIGVLALLLLIGRVVRSQATLLIVGILLSYLTSAIITLLGYYATAHDVQQLLLWGMGDFSSVGRQGLPSYTLLITAGLVASALLIKPMNCWMQGELYAVSLGVNLRRLRWLLLGVTGLLSAATTAWCGPIAFVGLAMPHVARLLLRTDDHRLLLPASMLTGALCCSLCLWLSTRPDGGTLLPINAMTPLFGVPVILYVLLTPKGPTP